MLLNVLLGSPLVSNFGNNRLTPGFISIFLLSQMRLFRKTKKVYILNIRLNILILTLSEGTLVSLRRFGKQLFKTTCLKRHVPEDSFLKNGLLEFWCKARNWSILNYLGCISWNFKSRQRGGLNSNSNQSCTSFSNILILQPGTLGPLFVSMVKIKSRSKLSPYEMRYFQEFQWFKITYFLYPTRTNNILTDIGHGILLLH